MGRTRDQLAGKFARMSGKLDPLTTRVGTTLRSLYSSGSLVGRVPTLRRVQTQSQSAAATREPK